MQKCKQALQHNNYEPKQENRWNAHSASHRFSVQLIHTLLLSSQTQQSGRKAYDTLKRNTGVDLPPPRRCATPNQAASTQL